MSGFQDVAAFLPASIKEIIEIIGFSSTEKLVNALGGSTFMFSQGASYYPKLKAVLGSDDAKKLRAYIQGGSQVYIPRCHIALKMARNQRFVTEFEQLTQVDKLSGRQAMIALCPKYNISDRTGWEIVRQQKTACAEAQILLF